LLPGGVMNPDALRMQPKAVEFVQAFFYAGKPLPNGFSIPATPYGDTFVIPGAGGFRKHSSVAPRLGMSWDLFGNGKTAIKANWGRFYFNTGLAGSEVNPAQSLTYTFNWVDRNNDKQFTMDEIGTFNSNAGGTGNTIDPNIKHTYTDSTSVWVEHELVKDIGVRLGYTYKSDGNSSQAVEQQRLGSLYTSQVLVADPGVDGLTGTADDGPSFVVFDTEGTPPASRTILQTTDGIIAIDRAIDFTITRRLRNNWSVMVNYLYNWDRDRGAPQNPNQERFNDNTVTNQVMIHPDRVAGGDHTMFVCGNDLEAKAVAIGLLEQMGWRDIRDLGDLTNARGMEEYVVLWVRLYGALGTGDFNVKVVH